MEICFDKIWFNIIGLMFDLVGVVLVFLFAFKEIPGASVVVVRGDNESEAKPNRSKFFASLGMTMIVIGFSLQIIYALLNL